MAIRLGSSRLRADSTLAQSGSAVLETALALPALLAVTAVFLTAMQVGITSLHLTDSAHDYARALARGVTAEQTEDQARREVPLADLTLELAPGVVTVTLAQDIDVPIPLLSRFSMTIERSASVASESS